MHSILIIDDEADNLKALERTLTTVAQVHSAASGKEGLEILKKETVSLIICDQRMPEMTGIEFFKAIKDSHPHIIRIILTGYTDAQDLIEAINEVGLYRYITKPWDNQELKLVIQRALEHFEATTHNKKLLEELKNVNEGLEKTVQERTQKLKELSITDELTQVGNLRSFWQMLKTEMERSSRYKHLLSLLMIDVDHFKKYNDEFGHTIGDKILKMIAQTLKKNIRNTDFLARYGGEEFVVILPETSQKQAQELAERLRKAVAKKKKKLTISVGVTCFTEKSKIKNSKKLVIQADKALYQAKRKGRNRVEVCFN
ncbi:MAG: hypothetical protein A2Z91_08130 [Deltaproteobacteria bacterium GWA2_38_16]|nr:MAG: hypothetical protein A2Z91_08130 [Deltaproteobacteria bacterium GWA2_38_16]OGQ01875.1 MAG: hypothetical protein A3D19_03140 [Deltaproteobacteria bacterium RIFCSPHIGHO2_02_FULL_38_15]OGQ29934.1 MAG: hypothetical protein A3A72_05810 [Deltaproteobacteria bacterium RIFCSPLOWO2_01_FULL_38_9]